MSISCYARIMHYVAAHCFSRRIKQLIGLLLCICMVASTVASAAAGTIKMAATQAGMAEELPIHTIAGSIKANHTAPNAHPNLHMYHTQGAPCDKANHLGQSDCPENCIVNLCCTAVGLSNFFNSLQLNAPKLTERYTNHGSTRCLPQQPSLVLRPPIA